MTKPRTISMSQLRKMIFEELSLLQGKDHPKDVSPDEMPWEEAEDVGRQDFVTQMDKPSPSVKAEAYLAMLERRQGQLVRRLRETRSKISAVRTRIVEARRRR